MMDDPYIAKEFLELMMKRNDDLLGAYQMLSDIVSKKTDDEFESITINDEDIKDWASTTGRDIEELGDLKVMSNQRNINAKINEAFLHTSMNFVNNKDSKLYLICDGVDKCSKMVRIGDNFSSKALRNVTFGKHTYLMGKNEVCRFMCTQGAIKGIYWNRGEKVCFEFGFDLESDGYYFDELYKDYFNKVAKIITFVELGDIEVLMLEKGRNNHKPKNDGKITNGSNYTVYVVDSSWNKIIIRTEGFAVMGHFRLQPCGAGLIDRKLIWIDAFEKHGYKRRPRAEIIK